MVAAPQQDREKEMKADEQLLTSSLYIYFNFYVLHGHICKYVDRAVKMLKWFLCDYILCEPFDDSRDSLPANPFFKTGSDRKERGEKKCIIKCASMQASLLL